MKQQPIVIESIGHHYSARYEGVPILWCQAVTRFHDEVCGNQVKQVPAVLLQTAGGPRLVLLQEERRDVEITLLRKAENFYAPRASWWRRLWSRRAK